ncbi:Hsp20 family protein [Fusicatenibacter saccharivorans]|uniref:Hsp20 family protein n=1 Tax=Lachnospiraceae TaxID=186803 RepID=UPI003CFC44D8
MRRERYAGNASRSFYVGNNVQREDIHPKFENGILSFTVPKEKTAVENSSHYIAIEG